MVNQKFSKLTGPQTGVLATLDAATPVLDTDTLPFIQGGVTKKVVVGDLVGQIAGTAATTGVADTAGVLTVAAKIAHLAAGEMSSLFYFATEFDFSGSAALVATKISNHSDATALAAKGTIVAAFLAITQVPNGTTSDVISISKDATPTKKMTGDLTITLASTQVTAIGNCFAVMPVAGVNAVVDPASEDIYACAAASVGRSTGKVYLFLIFRKTA